MLEQTKSLFPRFTELAPKFELEQVLPGASSSEVAEIESEVGVPLPESYKRMLQCARGFWLMGGVVQFGRQHPFTHEFPPFGTLPPQRQAAIRRRGGVWPPPSNGMLCFAEFFMEADGDQVLFDTSKGLVDGEYPVVYYAHEDSPPSVRLLAPSFGDFMEEFLQYEAFHT
jgi:hypothetical protein